MENSLAVSKFELPQELEGTSEFTSESTRGGFGLVNPSYADKSLYDALDTGLGFLYVVNVIPGPGLVGRRCVGGSGR